MSLMAASFDCSKASHPVEKAICSNGQLSKLDDNLDLSYNTILKKVVLEKDIKGLENEQKYWLKWLRKLYYKKIEIDALERDFKNRIQDFHLKTLHLEGKTANNGTFIIPNSCVVRGNEDLEERDIINIFEFKTNQNKSISFSILTTGGNCYRQCAIEDGTAEITQVNDYIYTDVEKSCTVRIAFDTNSIHILPSKCEGYCGDGASLDLHIPLLSIVTKPYRIKE